MHFERIFRSLVENTNDVIMVLDATPLEQGGPFIVYVNPAFERLMGYRAEEVMGQNPKILQGRDTDDKTRFKLRQAMRAGKAIRTQILNYDKFGNELWLDINMVPLYDEDGEPHLGLFGESGGCRISRGRRRLCRLRRFFCRPCRLRSPLNRGRPIARTPITRPQPVERECRPPFPTAGPCRWRRP